jgi:acyl-[acyl-carrier-protein]-phospholipid O-acyltransferase/long-chain-fatty-acid--[acyl-carrier-protein] ligase
MYGPRCEVVVVSKASERKGEVLAAVTNERRLKVADLRAALTAKGFSNLCVPREIHTVDRIPALGAGKVDYRACLKIALDASVPQADS